MGTDAFCSDGRETPVPIDFSDLFTPIPENLARHKVRAKYIPQPDGSLRLAMIQASTRPIFLPSGLEATGGKASRLLDIPTEDTDPDNLRRASRRAKMRAMDFILCNHDLDTFATLTFDPEKIQRDSWKKTYGAARTWLSNRVQRSGLKYIMVPEYHKDGDSIHFHAVMNASALDLIEARYPDSGRLIKRRKQGEVKQLYNLADWTCGWSSLERISGKGSRDKVAKYIFKYMGKQLGQRIGGRYFLHGGRLAAPVYRYGEDIEEFLGDGGQETDRFSVDVTDNVVYTEVSFL